MLKVFEAQKTASGYSLNIPSGFNNFGGMNFFTLKIRKPSGGIITKSLDINNLLPDTKYIKFTLINTDLDELGIYDYQIVNTTNNIQQIGKVLQFYVRENIY